MTAADWQASADPLALFRHLRGTPRLSPSRWFKWAVGIPTPLPERKLVQLLEAVCNHPPPRRSPDDIDPLRAAVAGFLEHGPPAVAALAALYQTFTGVEYPAVAGAIHERVILTAVADDVCNPPLADAIRCLFGDPFHPVAERAAAWRTAVAVHIARGIAADGDFSRLPVLADALEDGGCDHPHLLAHLRGGDPHQPGCHALDVVLGR